MTLVKVLKQKSSDPSSVMIFGCAILLYFTMVFERFWCFEVVGKMGMLILAGVLKQKLTLEIRPFEGSSDPSIFIIFGCAMLLYFDVVFL